MRNVIERLFGVIKKKFKLVVRSEAFSVNIQNRIVLAICVLHNCIRTWDTRDPDLDIGPLNPSDTAIRAGLDARYYVGQGNGDRGYNAEELQAQEELQVAVRRDTMAQEMWEDYQAVLYGRRRRGRAC